MSRPLQELFYQHVAITETGHSFATRRSECGNKIVGAVNLTHALTTAASNRFKQNRITHLISRLLQALFTLIRIVVARQHGHLGCLHCLLSSRLRTHDLNSTDRRSNEDDLVLGTQFRKPRILRQKTIAGVDGVSTASQRRLQHLVTV